MTMNLRPAAAAARKVDCFRTHVTVHNDLRTAGCAGCIAEAAGSILVQLRPPDPIVKG